MIPVLDKQLTPLMPCTNRRAKLLISRGDAKPYWRKGFFCIVLQRPPSAYNMQDVVIAIDPGSKRTGITVATPKRVVLNILANAPTQVKDKMDQRRALRRSRRSRKTPYRKCRYNRKIGGIPPSTKARWQAHLRLIKFVSTICPLTCVVIEDIKARTMKGAKKWNKSFSPLEVGKKWFEDQISKLKLVFYKFAGYETHAQRLFRGFSKTTKKLANVWEAHNVDSHCLAELYMGTLQPIKRFYRLDFLQPKRRQLHVTNPTKNNIRRRQGGTITSGLQRGCLVRHVKRGLCHIGGFYAFGISLISTLTGERISRAAKITDFKVVTNMSWRVSFC